jgi:hypothetical protein
MAQNQLQDHQVVAQTPTTMRRSAVDRFGCGAVSGGKDSLKKKKKKFQTRRSQLSSAGSKSWRIHVTHFKMASASSAAVRHCGYS